MPEKKRFSKEDIGGEILPILTTGLYKDVLDTIREYIQNSIDAQSQRIEIAIDPDTIAITDDGVGMTFEEARKAIRLGFSDKSYIENVGFRGIGIYSAFNLCDHLVIYTRSSSEDNCNVISFRFKDMRDALLKDQQQRKMGEQSTLYLEKLLEESVVVDVDEENTLNKQGTKAIMSNLLGDVYQRLNNWDVMVRYLQDVVPLPFQPNFRYANVMEDRFLLEEYRVVPVLLQIGNQREEIFRPYNNDMFTRGGEHPPKFFEIAFGKQRFGFAWVCINDARQVFKNPSLQGLLIKKKGFSISDRNYLSSYFGRQIINRRITGEVIVTNEELIPNAARSDFEHNSTRQAFLEALPNFIKKLTTWANTIQKEEKAKEVLADVTEEIMKINRELRASQRDREKLLLLNVKIHDIWEQLNRHSNPLKRISVDEFEEAKTLLRECQDFVKSSLLKVKKARKDTEKNIISSIQRESRVAHKKEQREEILKELPNNLTSLIDFYGLPTTNEMIRLLQFIDENILQVHLNEIEYADMIASLSDILEESY
jgi:exonuclease VII small subunit